MVYGGAVKNQGVGNCEGLTSVPYKMMSTLESRSSIYMIMRTSSKLFEAGKRCRSRVATKGDKRGLSPCESVARSSVSCAPDSHLFQKLLTFSLTYSRAAR